MRPPSLTETDLIGVLDLTGEMSFSAKSSASGSSLTIEGCLCRRPAARDAEADAEGLCS